MNTYRYPIAVMWNYGYQCNMSCIHCYSRVEAAENRSSVMTSVQAKYIAHEIVLTQAMHVHFGGGEPLMRDDFGSIAAYLTKAGVSVSLSSNGTYINEDMAQLLLHIPIDRVALSFHGVTSVTHDTFTRYPGSFDGLLRACENLVRTGVRAKIVYSLNAHTRRESTEVFNFAQDCGITSIQFSPVKITGNAAKNIQDLQLKPEEWKSLYKDIIAKAKDYPDLNIHLGFDNNPVVAGYIGKIILPCPCGRYSITVKPNGDVSPCNIVSIVVGNVFQQSLLDIWQNAPELRAIRNEAKSPCMALQA